jgi:hypothetical protein
MAVILVMWEVIGRRIDVQSWPQAKTPDPIQKNKAKWAVVQEAACQV